MNAPILIDTGPLVALLCKDDKYHATCDEQVGRVTGSRVTCWPVLTEAAYLLRHNPQNVLLLWEFCKSPELAVTEFQSDIFEWIIQFSKRFSDREVQFADAALVYIAERDGMETIFTLDRRDFSVYRTGDNRALHIIP